MDGFVEIEHKYILDAAFDKATFLKKLAALKPLKTAELDVVDHYYFISKDVPYIFRHRRDKELQQLTVKSLGSDSEHRLEVNLDLDQSKGDQGARVNAFLKAFGVSWQGRINKSIEVFYFNDCEIVFYHARGEGKEVTCAEFEAIHFTSEKQALETLAKYEKILGFDESKRAHKNLFDLLLRAAMEKSAKSQ